SAYGMFYQHPFRQGRENLLAENPPFLRDLTRSQSPGSPTFVTLDGGPPPNFFAAALPTDQAVRGNDPNLKAGNVQQWNLTVQYSLAKNWIFEVRSEEHTSELQSLTNLVCRLLLEKKKTTYKMRTEPAGPDTTRLKARARSAGDRPSDPRTCRAR